MIRVGNVIQILFSSPLEAKFLYKEDIEDARHLYQLFETKLNPKLLKEFLLKLDKKGKFNKYLA